MLSGRRFTSVAPLALALAIAAAPHARAAQGKEAIPKPEPFGRLTVDQAGRRLGLPNTYAFDGNNPETYVEHHLPGAMRVNHKDITPGILPADKDATLIFYCMNEL
jgi:hypothetical protein